MTLLQAIKRCLTTSYFTFTGRASRKEFWFFVLFLFIISSLITSHVNSSESRLAIRFGLYFQISANAHWLENLFTVLFFIPFIAVLTRRAHDTGRSGKMVLGFVFVTIALVTLTALTLPWQVPVIVGLAFVIFGIISLCRPSAPGSNAYGSNPHEVTQ